MFVDRMSVAWTMLFLVFPVCAWGNDVALNLEDDALCAEKNGKLVVLVNDGATPQTVWVDRWFMEVKTPDHTRHMLAPGEQHALGCSMTWAGAQHWTMESVR